MASFTAIIRHIIISSLSKAVSSRRGGASYLGSYLMTYADFLDCPDVNLIHNMTLD